MRIAVAAALLLAPCAPRQTATAPDPAFARVCTSMYPAVIEAVKPMVDAQAKGFRIEWEQGGSEPMRRKVESEKTPTCDLLLIADPWVYRTLDAQKRLVEYRSPNAEKIPAGARDPESAWVAARYSAMVLGSTSATKALTFADLAKEKRVAVAIGDPEFSGTNLITVAHLSQRYGWGFYESLRDKKVVVALSNPAVLERLEKGESDVGMVLLEVLLAARAKGSKVSVVVPKDGAIVIPGPIALLRATPASKAAYDAILSADVQRAFVEKGYMYAGDPSLPAPAGAPKLEELLGGAPLSTAFEGVEREPEVRARFAKLFARETDSSRSR